MSEKHIPVLPKPDLSQASDLDSTPTDSHPRAVRVACNSCRAKKSACNGKRPICARCASRHLECYYVTENEGETPSTALKRAYASLQKDHDDLKELLDLLKSTTQVKYTEILSNLRTGSTPCAILSAMREASTGGQQPTDPQSTHVTPESFQSSLDFTLTLPHHISSPGSPWFEDFPELPWSIKAYSDIESGGSALSYRPSQQS